MKKYLLFILLPILLNSCKNNSEVASEEDLQSKSSTSYNLLHYTEDEERESEISTESETLGLNDIINNAEDYTTDASDRETILAPKDNDSISENQNFMLDDKETEILILVRFVLCPLIANYPSNVHHTLFTYQRAYPIQNSKRSIIC